MSVKTYSLKRDGSKRLSAHFRVREFRCKDGSDKILIESKLIEVLEKVHEHFNCKAINITSGYRTAKHDKAVGGRGAGPHVAGKAADFKCVGQDGAYISSKEIALYLEDLGVKGIGYRCGGSSTSTHVDMNYRAKKWYGDEKYSMSASIGSSFYKYFNVGYAPVTAAASLNLRAELGIKGRKKKTVKKGTKLKAADTLRIKRDGFDWVRVKYGSKHYWAAEKYLK